MKIAIAQLNFIVGDVHGNASKIEGAIREAEKQNADLLLTPELALLGYPPKDILLNGNVLRNQDIALKNLAKKCQKLNSKKKKRRGPVFFKTSIRCILSIPCFLTLQNSKK